MFFSNLTEPLKRRISVKKNFFEFRAKAEKSTAQLFYRSFHSLFVVRNNQNGIKSF